VKFIACSKNPLWFMTLRAIKLCKDTESLHFENKLLHILFKLRMGDLASGLDIMEAGRKRRVFLPAPK